MEDIFPFEDLNDIYVGLDPKGHISCCGEFLMIQVSINDLWWLDFAMIINAAFSLFRLISMKLGTCIPYSTWFSCCVGGRIVLLRYRIAIG